MDGVLVDLQREINKLPKKVIEEYGNHIDRIPEIFYDPPPIEGAIDGLKTLFEKYEVYILSTAPWDSPEVWKYKRLWVERYLGVYGYKRLILSHHKNLLMGDYLIDDRRVNGAGEFKGELIQFGVDVKNWTELIKYLKIDE